MSDDTKMTNVEALMTKKVDNEKVYGLEERTAIFGETVISFARKIPKKPVNLPLIN